MSVDIKYNSEKHLNISYDYAPIISVVIPAWNEEAVLGECLRCVRQQVVSVPYEIIVVDNASTDTTPTIAANYSCRLLHEPIRNQLLAKRTGVLGARGEIVVILDADCKPPTNWLNNIYNALNSHDDCVAVTGCYIFPKLPWWGRLYVFLVSVLLTGFYRAFLRSMPFVIGGNVAFRRFCCSKQEDYPTVGGIAQTELGLAKRLRLFGRIQYLSAMEINTSPRRFQHGASHFFISYKLNTYLRPYFKNLHKAVLTRLG